MNWSLMSSCAFGTCGVGSRPIGGSMNLPLMSSAHLGGGFVVLGRGVGLGQARSLSHWAFDGVGDGGGDGVGVAGGTCDGVGDVVLAGGTGVGVFSGAGTSRLNHVAPSSLKSSTQVNHFTSAGGALTSGELGGAIGCGDG